MDATESNTIKAEACLSECGHYRYWLSRVWNEDKDTGAFVCLNPSKATSLMSDITLSNCTNLAVQWGWGGFYIVNLFACMATDPNEMKSQGDPESSKNDHAISYISSVANHVVLAWGNGYKSRTKEVLSLLGDKPLYCIKKNKGGGYLHPSRIKPEDYLRPIII